MKPDPMSEDYKKDCKLKDFLGDLTDDIMVADGLADAFIGVASFGKEGKTIAIYDSMKIIERLIKEGMTEEEAIEYYEYNIASAYAGEGTPIYMVPVDKEVWDFKKEAKVKKTKPKRKKK